MFEKVNPAHPDKIADRIAGAIVDLAYTKDYNPKIAVEVLIGHGDCHIITETSVFIPEEEIAKAICRIGGRMEWKVVQVQQDPHLADNQRYGFRCGDNGIFKGAPVTDEQEQLACLARIIYGKYPTDGKYLIKDKQVVICQSNAPKASLREMYPSAIINPLGDWNGGTDVDTGATNRKLGSDMGDSITGGGLHGKDLSKADVSVNIYAWIKAQETGKPVELSCAIGDETVDGRPYLEIVDIARGFIERHGGFEKFAEWGLI